jgi:hypothetical protein
MKKQPEEMASAAAPLFVTLDGYRDGHLKSDVVLTTWSLVPFFRVKVALY